MNPPPDALLPDRFNLGPWQVKVSLDEVAGGPDPHHAQVHKLEPRAMRLLAVLAQAGGEVVLADKLLDAVWPGLVVTPGSLYDAVAQLRRVLGPAHIATVPRKGYRLVTAVAPAEAAARLPNPAATSTRPRLDTAPAAAPRLGLRSVAVLPFVMHGLPQALSFLSESLTGALIFELSRQPGLTVVALGTMLTFGQRHPPPQQLADELGVRYVVDGQLELRGDTLHVGVQVVDGRRGTQTWADEMALPANAWHATATVVVGRLARALRFELNDLASQEPLAPASDTEVQARAFAAQAWVQLFARVQTPETNQRATRLARSAVALAPELSQGWMCLAYADWRAGNYRWSDEPRDEQLARGMAEAERAVALDPRDPDALYVLSLAARSHGQRQRADETLRHCLRLSSSYAPAYGLLAYSLQHHGRHDEARAHCDKAFELSPLEPLRVIWHWVRAEASLATGDPRSARVEVERGMAVNPAYGQLYLVGAVAAWRLGATDQARAWVDILRHKHPAFGSMAAVRMTMEPTYDPACSAQLDQLLETLREAGLPAL